MVERNETPSPHEATAWRERLYEIIFEADTPAGKTFDVALLIAIVLSVATVMLESVESVDSNYHAQLLVLEWVFTLLFTVEYGLRVLCVRRPGAYVVSFFGVVDLLAILPTYLSYLLPGSQSLLVIRTLRLLRVFRVFKLARFLSEATALRRALWASRAKVTVFLVTVLILVVILGSAMYLIESGPGSGFTSIPQRHVLGNRNHDDSRIRRPCAHHRTGQDVGCGDHGARLQPDHRADGNRLRRNCAALEATAYNASMPQLSGRGARFGRTALQVLWHALMSRVEAPSSLGCCNADRALGRH